MNFATAAAVFPLVFLAELPDKTMFASLLLASRGHPLAVWTGASVAFCVHVAIAVSLGVAVFTLLPHRAVDAIAAAMFLGGAIYAFLSKEEAHVANRGEERSWVSVAATAAGVIFLAEWGDLTQILTANLAVAYRDAFSVAVGSIAALVTVAALAVASGSRLLAKVPVRQLRLITGVVLLGLAGYSLAEAV
jgi:Ca2+/H+ antiporter, TMEM165/GDT1 family